jgi:plasmid maintenance system antidote protein VapI
MKRRPTTLGEMLLEEFLKPAGISSRFEHRVVGVLDEPRP